MTTKLVRVLNLVISGIPSIRTYRNNWKTWGNSVLNLVISGIPSIPKEILTSNPDFISVF